MVNRKTRIAVFVSGGGTNLQALIDAQGTVINDGEIVLVVASNPGAYALERAAKAGIDSAVCWKKEHVSIYVKRCRSATGTEKR